jgi:sarcosine oxidase subunit beta
MPSSRADVLVVGAGVIGASCAYHLAKLGARVRVIDRAPAAGQGSTGRATGGFRAQYETAINVRLSLLAREKLLRFREELGVDPGYQPCGYLWLATTEAELARLRAAHAVQREAGLTEAELVDDPRPLNRHVRMDGVVGAAFCPTDGYIRPLEILRGYLEGAQRLGVEFRFGEEPGQHEGTGVVVNAAGPWAAELAARFGVQLPVTPLRRQVACTVPAPSFPADMPMTIWVGDGFHLRVRDGRVLLLLPEPEAPRWDTPVDDAWVERVRAAARERVPAVRDLPIERTWAGLYEMSPDAHAIVGWANDRLFLCNGSSGHGVMHAPALGQLSAEWIVNGKPSIALWSMAHDRFLVASIVGLFF